MGKAAKRERQKTNKVIKEEEQARAQQRAKILRISKVVALVLIIPAVVLGALWLNNKTDSDTYTAKISVAIDGEKQLPNDGVIEVELDYARAPKSAKHFIGFAKDGYYDGLDWHRVVEDFVIQSGDPNGDGTGSLGAPVVAELPQNGYKNGDMAWAKGGNEPAGTAGSQFFIVTGSEKGQGVKALNQKAPQADGSNQYQYGIIGKVTKGMAAAEAIEALAPPKSADSASNDGKPTKNAKVLKIQVFKNGKLIKRGDKAFPASTTTSTAPPSTSPSTEPTSSSAP